jgi:predicted nucleic acid-binding protein
MPVVDASVLVEYLAGGEGARAAAVRLLPAGHDLWAPHLVDAEVGQALRGKARSGSVGAARARRALAEFAEMPLRRVEHEPLLYGAWAMRENVSFYDALYLALARIMEQPLLTFDARLAKAAKGRAEVELLDPDDF